ncbi:MAG: hypothetical protein ACQESE_02770 [Nanobdellota archaeon]
MAVMLSSKVRRDSSEKLVVELELDTDEYRNLQGHVDNLHVFAEEALYTPARVSMRGKNEATKYFLIPRNLRKGLHIYGNVACNRLQSPDGKQIFVYMVDPYTQQLPKMEGV